MLSKSIKKGDSIYIGDGNLSLQVENVHKEYVDTIVYNDYLLKERKNMNLPGNRVFLDTITEQDKYDLLNFSLPNDIDMISVSFCRSA